MAQDVPRKSAAQLPVACGRRHRGCILPDGHAAVLGSAIRPETLAGCLLFLFADGHCPFCTGEPNCRQRVLPRWPRNLPTHRPKFVCIDGTTDAPEHAALW